MPVHAPTQPRFFPSVGASESDLLAFRDRCINPWSTYRNQHMARVALWLWYFLGRQWVDLDYEAVFDGVRGVVLRSAMDDGDMPRPVTNEIDPAVESAVIAMVKRQWTAKATPTSNDPAIKAAAQVANDQLNYRLEQLSWPDKRHLLGLHYVATGTGLIYTGWDRSYHDLKLTGVDSAVWCENCQTKLYSAEMPASMLSGGISGKPIQYAESASPVPDDDYAIAPQSEPHVRLNYCPVCEDGRKLTPYQVSDSEMESGDDPFGRPLGQLEPRGSSELEIDLPFEFYPQDGGFRQTPDSLRRWGRRKIRSMEWLEERGPHVVDRIQPSPINELLYTDPLLSEWSMLGRWSASLDAGILDNHANVDEVCELPSIRYPLGRYLLSTKDVVIEDCDLLEKATVDGEDVYVPRVQESASRFKIRPGEFWGNGLPANMISPQNRLNSMDSQIVEWRSRLGSPNIYMPNDMWVDNPVKTDSSYGGGKVFFFQPSLSDPEFKKPEVFGGLMMPDSVYQERDRVQADIQRQNGPNDATRGAAPKNVGATSGLQFLVDQDERSQALREDDLIRSAERSWRHLLNLEWVLRVDPDVYRVLGPNKTWSYAEYTGAAIRGQVEVTIERGPSVSRGIMQREAAREALTDGLIDLSSPVVRREMLELYGLDPDLAPETTHQVDHAERVWVDFRDKAMVRTLDNLDDPMIHYIILGSHLRSEEGERMADEADWDTMLRAIAGWQDRLARAEAADAAIVEFYGGRLGPDAAKDAYGKAIMAYDEKKAVYQQELQLANDPRAGAAGIPTPVPPTMPPPAQFLPALQSDRILMVWASMCQEVGYQPQSSPASPLDDDSDSVDPLTFIQFRALVEAYRLTAIGATGAPIPAPGAGLSNTAADKGQPQPQSALPATSTPAAEPAPNESTPEGGAH